MLLTCQTIFGIERGDRLVARVESATGEPCPCKQGRVCPLMPKPRAALDDQVPATA